MAGNLVVNNLKVQGNLQGRRGLSEKIRMEDYGTLHMVPEKNRLEGWLLNGGTSTTWTDAWSSSVSSLYVPYGTKALLLRVTIKFSGNGAYDYVYAYTRRKGVGGNDWHHSMVGIGYTNLASGVDMNIYTMRIAECDENGVIEYKIGANGTAYFSILGYFI